MRGRPFDTPWMREVFEEFWEQDGWAITAFSNLFLEPITPPAREVLLAASQVPAIADEFFDNFNEPQRFWPWIENMREARRFVAAKTHAPWLKTAARARFGVLKGQVRHHLARRKRAA